MNTDNRTTGAMSPGEALPLISVIVPVYKVEPFLPDCVESLRCQIYKNLEIILVDDGSPDRCGELCDRAAETDSRVRVIHKENGGLSSARNAGLDIAEGAYICFVDSDDFLDPDHLGAMYHALLDNSADLAACTSYPRVPEDAEYRSFQSTDASRSTGPSAVCECFTGREAVERALSGGVPVMACGKLYRAELLNGIRFPEGKLYEDLSVMFDILLQTRRVVTLHTDTSARYVWRMRKGSITGSRFSQRHYDLIEISERIAAQISARFPDMEASIRIFQLKHYFAFLSMIFRTDMEKQYRAYVREIREKIFEIYGGMKDKNRVPRKLRIQYHLLRMGDSVFGAAMKLWGVKTYLSAQFGRNAVSL